MNLIERIILKTLLVLVKERLNQPQLGGIYQELREVEVDLEVALKTGRNESSLEATS